MKTTQIAEEHVQQSNNLSEYSITFNNCMKRSIASTQIFPQNESNDKIHYYYDIERDNDSTENELLNINAISSQALYSNSYMTVDTAVLHFVNIYIVNNKTKACLIDDLRFLTSALLKPNRMPKTVFKVFKYVKQQALPFKVIRHYCCKVCQFYYGTKKRHCKACNSEIGYILFFEIDIISQIQYLFESAKHLADALDSAFQHTDTNIIYLNIKERILTENNMILLSC